MEVTDPKATLSQHLPHWELLNAHKQAWTSSLSELFALDPHRAEHYSLEVGSLFLDYSKSHLNETTIKHLLALADDCQLQQAIDSLFTGKHVNNTEDRPAWHSALRQQPDSTLPASSVSGDIAAAKKQMAEFVKNLHDGSWKGHSGQTITDVVNIGIGGSDLGPRMVCKALSDFHLPQVNVHFVANIDGAEIYHTLKQLNPETTLFIVASKSFSTLETLENAKTARHWIISNGCSIDNLKRHFVAISTNTKKATEFGIDADNIFPMWDWVGGRYSLWSAIGLPIAIAVGWQAFEALLEGAAEMDEHFATAEFKHNMPVILAFLTFWYSQFWEAKSQAVLPYCHQLQRFPDFLQQLDMESLGKSVNRDGQPTHYATGIAIWGTEESNGQHSFHQLFHQGTQMIPVDFITSLQPNHPHTNQHQQLLACCLSQSQAMLEGKTLAQARQELLDDGQSKADADRLAPHKVIPGNRPSNTLLLDQLTPRSLGSLIALYEHKVYVLSVLLNINAFDQWGVELGKQLGTTIAGALKSGQLPEHWDSSTRALAERILSR
ncbi:glucose-6-phosphate isomerase [Aestuariicella hydrocarbonica]|uniref:Glucose-6-phosphate isomerase n=1 Tax=Pseudomaricurvus hydrocarbonicus TaxID=1470433 RepID=A0A9E5JR17_9GAMM|nr:glucose-6-phosphate isomerase [Aestuariicella hydrocarbonica]NHO64934.1 glucose-6-phosphate isomerase [Aestuariicella hydrocarbonica]